MAVKEKNSGVPYIHLTWNGYKNSESSQMMLDLQAQTRQTYLNHAATAQSRFKTNLKLSVDEMGELIDNVKGLYSAWTEPANQKQIYNILISDVQSAVSNINTSGIYTMAKNRGKEIKEDTEKIGSALKAVNDVLKSVPQLDSTMTKFLEQGGTSKPVGPIDISNVFEGGKIDLLSYNAAASTSFINLKNGWEALEVKASAGNFNPTKTLTMTKIKTKKGEASSKRRSVKMDKVISDSIGQINTIKGELLEQAVHGLLLRGLQENLFGALKKEGGNLEVRPMGTDRVFDEILKKEVTKKSDVGIVVSFAEGNSKTDINIGFSAKAQFKDTPGTVMTTYLTSSLSKILERAALLDSVYDYHLMNVLAHDKRDSDIRKFVAAKSALNAIGGGRGDEIYFITYLDKIITLQDLFKSMANVTSQQATLTVSGARAVGPGKKIPGDVTQAYVRSNLQRKKLLSLKSSITAIS